jgi:hypothetical protein
VKPSMRRRRLTLRMWMVLVVAWGLFLGWVRFQGSWSYALIVAAHSFIAWAMSFAAAFALARMFGPTVRGPVGRAVVSVLLALALVATLYLAWAHLRSRDFASGLDHGLPYPDPGIIALERWFDARWPVSPGHIKLHGEFHTVAFTLGTMVLILAGMAGGLSGLLSNRGGQEGMRTRPPR